VNLHKTKIITKVAPRTPILGEFRDKVENLDTNISALKGFWVATRVSEDGECRESLSSKNWSM